MTPNIEVTRTWSAASVRSMCINHSFYTCGDNEDYSHMLDWVDRLYPSTETLFFIAEDIRKHSTYGIPVESIMFDLEREAVITYFEVKA